MCKSSSSTKLLLWNVHSIAKEEKLQNLLQIIDDRNVDIACITETWFSSKKGKFSKTIKDSGFDLNHTFRESKRGGGCAVLFKRNLTVKKGDASSTEFSSFEYSYITLIIRSGNKVIITCVYRKQEISFQTFCSEFTVLMNKLFKNNNALIVVGDFNVWIDQSDLKTN